MAVDMFKQKAWFINLDNCIGCRACEGGCKQEFMLPPGIRYRRVVTIEDGTPSRLRTAYLTMSCNHCEEPACIKSCPVNAIYKRPQDGIVLIDQAKCVGCKRCTWACPYGAPQFNPQTGKVEKCTFCVHRQEKGLLPACVITCMGLALFTGTLAEVDGEEGATINAPGMPDWNLTRPNIRFKPDRHFIDSESE